LTPRILRRKGSNCDAELLVDAFMKGWRHFISFIASASVISAAASAGKPPM